MQYGQKRNTCKVGTMSGVIVKEIRLLGRSHIQGKWERCLEGISGISGATHCRLKGVNILNNFKVFPFTTECLLLATKRNVFLHSAIQRMQVSYCCGPVGPGCCPRWWQTLALPMWCCFFMCTESKGYKVMEISSRVPRKGSSARQWAGGHIPRAALEKLIHKPMVMALKMWRRFRKGRCQECWLRKATGVSRVSSRKGLCRKQMPRPQGQGCPASGSSDYPAA